MSDFIPALPAAPYIAHGELIFMLRRLGAIWAAMGAAHVPGMALPLEWLERLRCCNGHVTGLDRLTWPPSYASAAQGAICFLCHEPVVITFPSDQTGPFILRDPNGVPVCVEHDDCFTNLDLSRSCAAARLGRG